MVCREALVCLELLFVFNTVQLIDFWIQADSCFARNLIAVDAFNKLPLKDQILIVWTNMSLVEAATN